MPKTPMLPTERKASAALASIFALRMLGLFLCVPVFMIEAAKYPGGDDASRVALAMGAYGLAQALFQLPLGWASDRFGRKPVIFFGLALFGLGSLACAMASTLDGLLIGRAIQGAGAVSAAVSALLADLTRDEVRTKAMAIIGASIGLVFALSLVAAPLIDAAFGLSGIFWLTAALSVCAATSLIFAVPSSPAPLGAKGQSPWAALSNPSLARLYAGVFILHAAQMAMWVAIPAMLIHAGVPKGSHAWIYLPAVLGSFIVMGGILFRLERSGKLAWAMGGAILAIGCAQGALAALSMANAVIGSLAIGLSLFVFFCGFNIMEASQPSLATKIAPLALRGSALGLYNTAQSLGLFAGAALGGLAYAKYGQAALFAGCCASCALWLGIHISGARSNPTH